MTARKSIDIRVLYIYIVSICESYTEYAFATLIAGANKIETIDTIITLGEERNCTFSAEELEKLFEPEGMPLYSQIAKPFLLYRTFRLP